MFFHKKDIEKIQNILEKFPDVNTFTLKQVGDNGIGNVTTMNFHYKVNGVNGNFDIEISGVEDW
jgi:hypothetical protein